MTHVYNPLEYAWAPHELYLARYARAPKRVLFLGMNPGPFGMVQTGVPFGEVDSVRRWLQIESVVGRPRIQHPRRPVSGFSCARSEVSGKRLWGLFEERFQTAKQFFREHLVLNYCPLAFLESEGRNRTPDKLPRRERDALHAVCDAHLRRVAEILQPEWVVGVGGFAAQRAAESLDGGPWKIRQILHPSPASPAANRDWTGAVTRQMLQFGIWHSPHEPTEKG